MPVSATTNTASIAAQRSIAVSSEMNSRAMSELATGSRIARASDAAAEAAIGAKLKSTVSVLSQASRNTSEGASLIQVATDALKNISTVLTRLKTLSAQVINGSLSDSDKMMAREEFLKLKDLVENISTQTRWNGVSMLAGGAGKAVLARTNVTVGSTAGAGTTVTVANTFAPMINADLKGAINGKVSNIAVGNYTAGVVGEKSIIVTMQNGETFHNEGVVHLEDSGSFILTSTSNSENTMKITFSNDVTTSGTITNAASFKAKLEVLLQTGDAKFSGSAVQSVGASSYVSGSAAATNAFTGSVSCANGVDGKVASIGIATGISMTPATAAATGYTVTAAGDFQTNIATTGAVNIANFVHGSASVSSYTDANTGTVRVMIGTEEYTTDIVAGDLATSATNVFTSTTNASRTFTLTNSAGTAHANVLDFAADLNTFLNQPTLTGAVGTDAGYATNAVVVTLEDGSVYKNAATFTPSSGGTMTLTNVADSSKTISLTQASNVSGLTTNAATLVTHLGTSIGSARFFESTNSGSVTASGLDVQAAGFTSVVRGSTGFISGSVRDASVMQDGNKYKVMVSIGNQIYTNTVDIPNDNGALELVSTTDAENKLVFQYGSSVSSAVTDATSFNSTLRSFLGLQNGTAPAQFKPDSGATGGDTGIDAVVSGASANPGKYSVSYKPDASGLRGQMKLTDGVNVLYHDIAKGGQQVVSFTNGISISLGASFAVATAVTPRVFDIIAGPSVKFDFQVAEKSEDILSVSLESATLDALRLTHMDINTLDAAKDASVAIDTALESVNKSYAKLGAQQKQLEVNKDILSSNITNMQAALSEFIDADVPEAMTRMTSSSVQYQIASAMLVQANERTQQLLSMTR